MAKTYDPNEVKRKMKAEYQARIYSDYKAFRKEGEIHSDAVKLAGFKNGIKGYAIVLRILKEESARAGEVMTSRLTEKKKGDGREGAEDPVAQD